MPIHPAISLGSLSGRLYPDSPRERAEADRWMDWHLCHFLSNVAVVFFGLVRTPPADRNLVEIEAARVRTCTLLAILDNHLARRDFVAGSALTMGDIAIGGWVHRWFAMQIERPHQPHLEAWYQRLSDRAPYQIEIMSLPL